MISVEEALERILAYFQPLEPREVPLLDAIGQVLAQDITSGFDIPPLANTAMDGYAVQAASTRGASTESPVELRVVGELAAGYIYDGQVEAGTAVRIMTGAPIPAGADAIVPFEETDETGQEAPTGAGHRDGLVRILKEARLGANVRPAGEDVHSGELVLKRSTLLHAAQLGVIASLGHNRVSVMRRPVVAVLSTGDELLEPGEPRQPGQIYDSNAYSIASLVKQYGGIPRLLGVARDTVEDLTQKLRGSFDADMIVTTAGVSRGDFDVVKVVLAREGEIDFWTVNMRPGKPLAFGAFNAGARKVPHIGLPGNPVSAMLAFEIFGRPAIFTMLGRLDWQRPRLRAIMRDPISMGDPRRFYARCVVEKDGAGLVARLAGSQSSGALSSMARANAVAVIPENHPDVKLGEEVEVIMLNWETDPALI